MRVIHFIFIAALGFSITACRISKNFHVVDQGKVYRSAQLTGSELEDAITKYKINTIINLQGKNPDEQWYIEEQNVTRKYGVKLIDIAMSTESIPQKQSLIKLLEAFASAPRPILIHCRAGADRSGEAAALYQIEYMGKSKEEALKMLHPKYLHLSLFVPAKKYFVNLYQGQRWAYKEYDPCNNNYYYFNPGHFIECVSNMALSKNK
jgi:protein tyrosine/serine phosphatase